MLRRNTSLTALLGSIAFLVAIAAAALPLSAQSGGDGAQTVVPVAGTEFFIGFVQNSDESDGAWPKFMGLLITSQVATTGTVEIPGFESRYFSTKPGQYTQLSIPRAFEHEVSEDTISAGTQNITSAIHVTSRAPVSIYVVNDRYQSVGGFAAVPVDMWGTHYVPMTLPNMLGEHTSELMIVAGYDDTWIRFTPSATTYRQDRGVVRQIKLQKGRTYFVKALASTQDLDLTGSEISSTKPVGVVCGHVRTPILLDGSIPSDPQVYASHQAVMILPDTLWGREYVSVPLRATGDRFRVMPATEATIIITGYLGGSPVRDTLRLEGGQVSDVASLAGRPITGPVLWQCSAPATIAQLRTSGTYGDPSNSPAMTLLTPTDRYPGRIAFVAPEQVGGDPFANHQLTLIAHAPAVTSTSDLLGRIRVDGQSLSAASSTVASAIGGTGFWEIRSDIASGAHLVTAEGVSVTGVLSGSNGPLSRDAYAWALPYWGTPEEFDRRAPMVVGVQSPTRGLVTVTATDQTGGYFSGVSDIAGSSTTKGWTRISFNSPQPDEEGIAAFRAISDPSGPLTVLVTDRDGNGADTLVHPGVCFKTATADVPKIALTLRSGSPATSSFRLQSNVCGDQANVRSMAFDAGSVNEWLQATTDAGAPPLTIAPYASVGVTVSVAQAIPVGDYATRLLVTVDDSVIAIPITLHVDIPGAVDDPADAAGEMTIVPNPLISHATIRFGRSVPAGSALDIADALGRIVRHVDAAEIGRGDSYVWNARGEDGQELRSGVYFVRLRTPSGSTVRTATLLR